jgi:hypothetical protein
MPQARRHTSSEAFPGMHDDVPFPVHRNLEKPENGVNVERHTLH